MDARRAEGFTEGSLGREELDPSERAIEDLVRKSARTPARLGPGDLAPLVALVGAPGALEVVAMLGAFHFVTRIADLVGIEPELPIVRRRWRWLRSLGVRVQSRVMRRVMDLANRPIEADVPVLLAEMEKIRGGPLPEGYRSTIAAPNVAAWAHRLTLELPTLDPALLAQVSAAVAAALPASEDEATGFHGRPTDPVDALAFVGTRYAVRTTDSLVDAVRKERGWGDGGLTELFFAISARNAFERVDRLLAAPVG